MTDTFRPEDHSDQHEHEMRNYGSCTVCTERKAEENLFLDAAERGLVTEPEDAPHSETEMVPTCCYCRGCGEIPVRQYEDGQWETARCPECKGTGAVTY